VPRRVLIVSCSHGDPPTQPRPHRARELGAFLVARGVAVEHSVFVDAPLTLGERRRWVTDDESCGRVELAGAATIERAWGRLLRRAADGLGFAPRACPRVFHQALRRRSSSGDPVDAVIVLAARLLPAIEPLRARATLVLDVHRLDGASEPAARRIGREDASAPLVAWTRAVIDGALPGAVLLRCEEDAALLGPLRGGARRLLAPVVAAVRAKSSAAAPDPVRPPRILFVGSETIANLDGLRWFRHRVLPRVRRLVPSCRLRIVGEAGRHIEPGADIDRVGWVDDLSREYRDAAVVVLPLRIGGRFHRRAVEALAHGKALAMTSASAYGLALCHRDDAIVASDDDVLAQGVVDVLSEDVLRRRLEERAREIAAERFAPEPALAPLAELIERRGAFAMPYSPSHSPPSDAWPSDAWPSES